MKVELLRIELLKCSAVLCPQPLFVSSAVVCVLTNDYSMVICEDTNNGKINYSMVVCEDTNNGKINYSMVVCEDTNNGNQIIKSTFTMSLKNQIDSDIKQAMLAKDKDRLMALRSIKSLILIEETKEGRTHGTDLSEVEETQLLSKAAKQRRESSEIFVQAGRQELADKENAELAIIEIYLPKQFTEAELKDALLSIIARLGASAPSDMGKVMGVATKELAGKADGKAVSQMVKQLLS